jgi:hypothetical protein
MNRSTTTYVDLTPLTKRPMPPEAPYFIVFHDAPANLKFFLKKNPRFATKREAFTALHHYEFEFGVYGNVFTKFGLEHEEVPMQPINDNMETEDAA